MRYLAFALTFVCLLSSSIATAENPVVTQATNAGIKKCLPEIKDVSDFLIENGKSGTHSTWNSKSPNDQIFTSVIERNYSDGTIMTSLTVAPVTSGQCATVYDQIMHFQKSCMAVAKETFAEYSYVGDVNNEVVILEKPSGANVYLLSAEGGGCLGLKKEVLMGSPK